MPYLAYDPALEQTQPDETQLFERIAETFKGMTDQVQTQHDGHAARPSHAKSTALLTGTLIVADGLPPELAQGLCAAPARYEALVRFAQGPGEMLDDDVSTHRGMAIKLLSVPGARIPESREAATQDWLLAARDTAFLTPDATAFLAELKAGVSNAPSIPQRVKELASDTARAVNRGLEAVGAGSKRLGFFGHPKVHPLSECYFSQAPLRWGDHVAKLGMVPTDATVTGLAAIELDTTKDFNTFRTAMLDHFAKASAEFELRVQLATDPEQTPIESASQEWPEADNPYRTVARLVLPRQEAWSTARHQLFDERLSFQPANSVAAHRPLGQIMRARLFVYDRVARHRQQANGIDKVEPRSIDDIEAVMSELA